MQGSAKQCRQQLRHLLCSINKVFHPLDSLDTLHCEHVPSIKKMKARDANCNTCKVILGWIVDTVKGIITLPEHCYEQLLKTFEHLCQ